jgi:hypothetical protein
MEAAFSCCPSSCYCFIVSVEVVFEEKSFSVIDSIKFVCQYLVRSLAEPSLKCNRLMKREIVCFLQRFCWRQGYVPEEALLNVLILILLKFNSIPRNVEEDVADKKRSQLL